MLNYNYIRLLFQLLVSLLFIGQTGFTQAQQYSFYYPEINKQLPQQFVYTLSTDFQGYLWVGTGEGLVKFDGNQLSPIKINSENSSVFCTAICPFNKQMVVGFFDGTVAIGSDDHLIQLNNSANGKIVAIAATQNQVYIGAQNELFVLEGSQLKSIYRLEDGNSLASMAIKPSGELILATSNGLFSINPSTRKTSYLVKGTFHSAIAAGNRILAQSDSSIYSVNGRGTKKLFTLTTGMFVPGNPILSTGNIVYTTAENRLLQLELGESSANLIKDFKATEEGLTIKALNIVNDQMWIGTYGNGLAYFNPYTHSVYQSKEKSSAPTVALLAAKSCLMEFTENGANCYNYSKQGEPDLKQFNAFVIPGKPSSAALVSENTIMVGTQSGKVFSIDGGNLKLQLETNINSHLPGKSILAVNADNEFIYVAVAFNGVYTFDKQDRLINHYSTENGLLHNDIFKVFTDRSNHTWFVSRSSGLAVLHQGQFQYLTLRDGLSSLEFTDITQDNSGKIWLSTEGGGLTSISDGKIENYNLESGLSSDYFYGIAASDSVVYTYSRGSINILVNNNLRRIDSREIGLTANFSPRSITIGKNWISIGSEYGPVVQHLEKIFQENSLKLLVKKVLVNDEKFFGPGTQFDYKDFKMEFRVEQINLDPFFQPQVEFKLDGFDKEWQTLTGQSVIYQSIKDNDYQFIVRDRLFPENSFTFSFAVDKPFWKKPIYYLLIMALISLLVYSIFKFRLKQLKERNRELEQKVAERTKELKNKNTELEQFTFAMSHDLKNPAINIVELVKLLKNLNLTADEMTSEVIAQLSSVSTKMLNNLMDLIDLLKHANTQDLPKEKVSLPDLVEHVQQGIAQSMSEANAEVSTDFSQFDSLVFNKSNLQSIFQNLISNAVKYRIPGEDARIEIKSFFLNGRQAISIKDNGMGMDLEANKDRLFGIFQRLHHHVEGSGIGLHLVKSIMEKHKGEIQVISSPGNGSTFTLVFAG